MKLVLCVLGLLVVSAFGEYDGAIKAVKKFKENDSSKNLSRVMSKIKDIDDDKLKAAFVKAAVLYELKNNVKNIDEFLKDLKDGFGAVELPKSICKGCKKCDSKGHRIVNCVLCKGTGKCCNKKCQKGEVITKGFDGAVSKKACAVCKRTLKCLRCNAEGSSKSACRTCKGRGYTISKSLSKKLKSEMKKFYEQFAASYDAYLINRKSLVAKAAQQKILDAKLKEDKANLLKNDEYCDLAKTTDSMEATVKEFGVWLNRQKRSAGASLATKTWGKKKEGKAILYVQISNTLLKQDKATKKQITDGMLKFWKLRCSSNSISRASNATVVLVDDNGNEVK